MAARPAWIAGWTAQHVRHAAGMFKQGGNPAARVYESIGPDFFLAVAPGWLNPGLWQGPGSEREGGTGLPPARQDAALQPCPPGGRSWMWGMGLAPRTA